eukprot:scpid36524/ scgid17265/ 
MVVWDQRLMLLADAMEKLTRRYLYHIVTKWLQWCNFPAGCWCSTAVHTAAEPAVLWAVVYFVFSDTQLTNLCRRQRNMNTAMARYAHHFLEGMSLHTCQYSSVPTDRNCAVCTCGDTTASFHNRFTERLHIGSTAVKARLQH